MKSRVEQVTVLRSLVEVSMYQKDTLGHRKQSGEKLPAGDSPDSGRCIWQLRCLWGRSFRTKPGSRDGRGSPGRWRAADLRLAGYIWRKAIARPSQGLAEQVTPFGGQAVAGELVDLHPQVVFEAAFGHHQVDMGFKAEVAAEGMDGVDRVDVHTRIEIFQDFTHGLGRHTQQEFQQGAVSEEEGTSSARGRSQ